MNSSPIDTLKNFFSNPENYEFEIRFGVFNGGFQPTVQYTCFKNIEKYLYKIGKPKVYTSSVKCFADGVRVVEINGKEKIEKKTKKDIADDLDYGIRYCISEEVEVEDTQNLEIPIFYREKSVKSFVIDKILKYDLYSFKEGKTLDEMNKSKRVFCVEIEFINNELKNTDFDVSYDIIRRNVAFVLKNIQESNFLISETERKNVLDRYFQYTKESRFIGMQSVSMNLQNFKNLKTMNYSVTEKADGERKFLCLFEGCGYLVSGNMKIQKTSVLTTSKDCILDCELISGTLLSVFDIVVFNGEDLRGNQKFLLNDRMEIIKILIGQLTSTDLKITRKKMLFGNPFKNSRKILDYFATHDDYIIDGLVFTPVDEPYPKLKTNPNLLKWKPEHLNTIDFQIKKQETGEGFETWHLLSKSKTGLVNFAPYNYENVFISKVKSEFAEKVRDNCIVEFKFENGSFSPLRVRTDKNAPNYIAVAYDIFKIIQNPVTEKTIRGEDEKTLKSVKFIEENVDSMRKFHNWIKSELIIKYSTGKDALLDLACGKAGDLSKWIKSDVKEVLGVDINPESIKEGKRKLNNMNTQGKKITLETMDLSKSLIVGNEKYDLVNCQFAMHYFFKSEESFDTFFRTIQTNLKEGGFFIGTVFDGMRVFNNLLENREIHEIDKDGNSIFKVSKNYQDTEQFDDLEFLGQAIDVYLGYDTVLNKKSGTREYLVNFNKTISLLKQKYGLELVESDLFESKYKEWVIEKNGEQISDKEKKFSFLNRTFVFQKTGLNEKIIDTEEFANCFFSQEQIRRMKEDVLEKTEEKTHDELKVYEKDLEMVMLKKTYSKKSLAELRGICKSKNIKISGTKPQLIERLASEIN